MLSTLMLFLLFASSVGFPLPPEWREVIQTLCAEANNAVPSSSVQVHYGKHLAQMKVSYNY